MKFSDVITAVASIVVLTYLFEYPLGFVFNLQTNGGQWADGLISILLSALIVGIVFAGKIWEETRTKAILRILVLVAVLFIVVVGIGASSSDWISAIREANPHPTYTASDWYYFDGSVRVGTLFINTIAVLAVCFIGLYIGSMLRKPSATTK